MSAQPHPIRRKVAAKRPAPRTIEVGIAEGDFAGWRATVRVDFPARLLADMQSGNVERIMAAAEELVIDHNFPDTSGEVAARLSDVDPFIGIVVVINQAMGAVASLPPR